MVPNRSAKKRCKNRSFTTAPTQSVRSDRAIQPRLLLAESFRSRGYNPIYYGIDKPQVQPRGSPAVSILWHASNVTVAIEYSGLY